MRLDRSNRQTRASLALVEWYALGGSLIVAALLLSWRLG